jgi:predicted PurR-regulated permease PerM
VELTLTLSLLTIVLVSMLTIFMSVQRSTAFVQNRSQALDEMRLVIDQMTKEIRQATSVSASSTSSMLDMQTYVLGVSKHIVYQASATGLTRTVNGGTTQLLAKDLASFNVFTYTDAVTSVQLVGMTLQVHPKFRPNTTLVLASEARLRNGAAA